MMTNLLFNRLTAIGKRLAMVLTMLLIVGVGSMLGQTFTRISAASDLSDGDEIIFVNQAGTYACGTTQNNNNRTPVAITTSSNSYSYKSSDNVQVFIVKVNGSNYGFHNGSGYIYSASSSNNYLRTNTTASTTAPSGTAAWTLSVSNNVFTVKNASNTSYYLAFNGTSYFSQYKSGQSKPYIYKKVTSTYEIIAKSNNETYGTVSLTGTTITAYPKTGYRVSTTNPYSISPLGSATVKQNGNTFTVAPSANTTITINFEATPTYTVNWYVNDTKEDSQTAIAGTELTNIPDLADYDCNGKVFVGWTTQSSYSSATTAPIGMITNTSGMTMPEGGENYYAVFATQEGGTDYLQITSENDLVAGGKYLIVGNSGSTYKALPVGKAESLTSVTPSSSKISNPATELVWTLEGSTDKWKIKSTSNDKYLQISSSSLTFETSTTLTFSVSVSSSKFTFTSSASSGNKILSYYHNGNKFNAYTTANTVYLYKQGTTYSDYTTSCTTQTSDCSLLKFTSNIQENHTATYAQNVTANSLTVSALYNDNSNGVTYQWYSNTTKSNTEGTPISGETNASYTPVTTTVGTKYYYCVATYDECTINSNVATVTITEPVPTFTVTFDSDGGSTVASQNIEEGNKAIKPEDPTKKGYDFVGWYNGNTEFDFDEVITGNITLTAKWNIITYNITYEGLEGATHSNPSTYNVETATITFTDPSNREDYVFKGWTPATIAKGSTGDKTVTATWAKVYTITWMVGGNEYTTGSPTTSVESNQKISSIPEAPDNNTLADCGATKFMGWSETNIGSTPDADAPTDLFTTVAEAQSKIGGITENKTFYAVFATAEETTGGTVEATLSFANTQNRVSHSDSKHVWAQNDITFTNNKASSTSNVNEAYNPIRCYKNSSITITHTSNEITKIVFDCNGTDNTSHISDLISPLENSGTGTVTRSDDIITITFNKSQKSFTLNLSSGQVRLDGITVTAGGGTITTYSNYVTNCCNTPAPTNGAYTSVSGTEIKLTWDDAANTNRYHITGGNLSAEGVYSTNKYYNITGLTECEEYTFNVAAYPADGCESAAITITAQPFSGAKTVTFNPNGGDVSPTSFTTSCDKKSTTLPTPTYSGYRFMGWYTEANGGILVNENPYSPDADITLYAHWAKEYTVTYDANGGSTTCVTGNYIEGETVTLCTSTPSKAGYTFAGWSYSPEVTITEGKFTMPASNVTITAQWTINQYTVTWEPNGGNWAGSTENIVHTYDYGATINRPADPTRDGYRFTGWNTTVASTMPATNITYTAQWKQNYTITFHDGDDTTPWTQTADAESINLTEYVGTLACDDYQFAGWSTDATKYDDEPANITTWVTGNYTPTANIDLYAVYTKGAVTNDFTLNCAGGVYEIWEKGKNTYMAGRVNSTPRLYTKDYWNGDCTSCDGTDGTPFTITKIADNTYTIQNSDGEYLAKYWNGNHPDIEEWDSEEANRFKWTISEGTNGSWRFVNKEATEYALVKSGNYFDLCSATSVTNGSTSYYDLELTPATSNVYQSNPNCGPYYIIFNTHGGEFIQGEYAYGEEQTGLTETTYSKFPAAELEGYTFAGWKDGTPQDEINYEPLLKKPDDNLVVSSNKTYHAVYYYYDEEEDIDWSEEFTTGIYADVSGTKYFLTGTPSSGTMSSTIDCEYASEVTVTPGTSENTGKYKITVNGKDMAPKTGDTDLVDDTFWWTIEETSAGSGEYKISGEDKRNIVLRNSSFGHYSYNAGSSYGAGYYYPRFGKCLEHHWTSNPTEIHTLTWNVNGGDPLTGEYTTGSVEYGTTIIPPANPTRTGYTFAGWGAEVAQTMPDHDLVYTAQWTANTYTITLDQQEGTGGSESIEVTFDAELPAITVPTREGYTFGGYFTSENGEGTQYYNQNGTAYYSKKWDIASTATLYAKWTAHTYTVIYNANNGVGEMNPQSFIYDVEQALNANQFTRVGYSFAGWNDKANGSGNSYADQQVVKNLTATKVGQKTLYALWTANTNTPYVVKHYKEQLDGTYPAEADDTDNLTGTTDSYVTPEVKSYEGFTAPSTQKVSIAADGSTVVTYKYTRNSYNLSWNLAGGIITTEGTAQGSVKYEAPITAPTVAKTGYKFMSWSPEVPATMPAANVTCTAQWTANTYTITLDQQEATTPGITTVEATYGSALPSIAENLPTKTGYDFGGYYTEINGNGTQYYHGTGTGARNWDIASETTLYAYWKPNTCTLIFNMNGGVGEQPNLTATYDQPMPALTAPLPTLSGFEFSGYFDEKTGGVMYYNAAGESARNWDKTNGEKTLYAQWDAIHTVTWMVNGSQAEGDPTTSVVNGQTITTLPTTPDVDCNGKVFVGWTTATIHGETATIPDPLYTKLSDFPVVTSDMTFYAVFANGSGDERWVETEIGDIQSGDEVVITMTKDTYTYAMSNNQGTKNAPEAIVISVKDGIINEVVNSYNQWTIIKNNESLVFYADVTTRLYGNQADDGIRVGSADNALTNHEFFISGNYLVNVKTSRFVGVNITKSAWYSYSTNTGNIANQTLKFYKKTIVYTSYTNYSTSCIDGVCDITNANPIYVTSAAGQKIKATDKLVLTTTDMAVGTEISLSAPNITFYKEGEEITQLTTTAASETFELEIAYQPTIANTTEQPTITLEILGYQFAFDNKITGRCLPETFAIVTKAGATWYALPANLNGATNPAALVVEVDETAMTAVAPNTTPYTLWPVKTTSGSGDRFAQYGDRVRFSAVNNEYKGLWANDAKDANTINNYAKIDEVTDDAAEAYEWKITTTVVDGQWQYTLQSDQPNNQNYLGYRMAQDNPAWGTYASSNNLLYFLPITAETTPFDYKVVEWYPNKLLIHTTTAFSSLTAKIAGEQVANVQYTAKDANQYEVTGLPLIENPAKALTLEFVVAEATHTGIHTIPVMLSGGNHSVSTLAIGKGIYNYTDLVVRDGATLTIDGATNTDNTFYDVTIYPTAKISVPEGKQLSVHRMTFLGGISEIYNSSTYELNKYGVPQLSLKGTLGKTVTTMDYIMRVNLDQMYQVGVPYDVNLGEITYWDGTKITLGDALYVSAYDGQARANRDKKTWVYETDFETRFGSATLKAGVGYTISAEPQSNGDEYSILRMPMKSNIASGSSEEAKTINVVAYDNEKGVTITDNHKGWNYLSNPYMTTISGSEADTKLVLGYLKETGTGPWEWVETTQRYVTIPMDNGKDYYQKKFSEAELKPFKSFFVQIAQGGELSFALASRQNAPARLLQQETTPSEIEFELLLSNATQSDNTGLLISEEYTPAYEINADLEKMMSAMSVYTIYNGYNLAYNALSPLNAIEQIPVGYIVPAEGEYTLELDPNSDLDAIKHIYLMDYDMGVTTDLINDAYTFYAADTKSDKRFAINIELSSDIENKPTGFEDVGLEGQRSYKFIYDGILYIMNNGVIYSTTGQQLNTMDK